MKSIYQIVGMRYRSAEDFVKSLPAGEPLTLIREPDNPHDHFAVQVWARERHVAYVKSGEARGLAKFMDSGATSSMALEPGEKEPPARMMGKLVTVGHWPQVEVEE